MPNVSDVTVLLPGSLVIGIATLVPLFIAVIYFIFEPAISLSLSHKNDIDNGNPKAKESLILEHPIIHDDGNKNDDSPDEYFLSLVVPAYNEEERLPPMLQSTISYLQKEENRDNIIKLCSKICNIKNNSNSGCGSKRKISPFQIIIANDGSTDGTVQTVKDFARKAHENENSSSTGTDLLLVPIQILTLTQNLGKGAAVKAGMIHPCNKAHLRLMVDADGATNIESLSSLLMEMVNANGDDNTEGNINIAFGSRAHLANESKAKRSKVRTFLMNVFHFFVKTLCSSRIHDTQCGFKLFTKDAALALFHNLHLEQWAFDTELVVIAENLNMPIVEVGVEWQEIDGSKLHTGKLALIKASACMLRDMICVRACYWLGLWVLTEVKIEKVD
uniref:dolichyl-phosphate beta-glucosyltransferase n=1 Tax=Chaetoceros debilis TaxID=122233 RepID=A0A7S3V3V0_9STRA